MDSYSGLANLTVTYPEMLILRKYTELNAKNLLYYQAELAILEAELKQLEEADKNSHEPVLRDFGKRWSALTAAAQEQTKQIQMGKLSAPQETRDSAQWRKFLEIRRVLAEYSKLCLEGVEAR